MPKYLGCVSWIENSIPCTYRSVIRNGNSYACRYLGDTELNVKMPQVNITEKDNHRTWASQSVCEIQADRKHYGKSIRCVAIHPAYTNPNTSSTTEVRFNVQCKPKFK